MKLLIIDRDGTLNRNREDYVASPDEWEALPGALEAVARMNHGGWRVVVATNQSGIGRGLFDMAALNAIHTKMHRQLAAVGGRVEAVFFCPHAPEDACACRKPEPGLFYQIGQRFCVPLSEVLGVGNAMRHVQAAAAAECQPHLFLNSAAGQALNPLDPLSPVNLSTDLAMLAPELPPGTRAHADLNAFADWLLTPSAP